MYRIIAGKWKGKRIVAPKNFEVRPTTDYAKEGLFNILSNAYHIPELKVLDLYAGIGSISFEFASRGCQDITAVDSNYKHCRFIEKQAEDMQLSDIIKVYNSDVIKFLDQNIQPYSLIFADAPFDTDLSKYEEIVELIYEKEVLINEKILILEHSSKVSLESIPNYSQTRKYGNVSFSFFEKE